MTADNEFLQRRHAEFEAPQSVVFDIIQQASGDKPVRREKIVAGYDSEVYSVKTEKGKEFIIRLNRYGDVGFKNEAWAMEQTRQSGVPVPEIFFLDEVAVGKDMVEVMVTNKLEGRSLADMKAELGKDELAAILEQAGDILRKFHAIKTDGFYHRHEDDSWDFSSWEAMMDACIRDRLREVEYVLKAGFSNGDVDFMIDMLKRYKEDFPCRQPTLCHGDYLSDHIFVTSKKKISGIIDFGMFEGNSPVHDFAYVNFEEPELGLSAMKAGYGSSTLFDDSFDLRLNLHQLALQIGHLSHNMKIGDNRQAEVITKSLTDTVSFLRSAL